MPNFLCQTCQKNFSVPDATLAKFPGWKPKICFGCKKKDGPNTSSRPLLEENLSTAEVLEKYTAGPVDGVFTDGAAHPNPGQGGWGAVYVIDNRIVAQDCGTVPQTTNNRMELQALIEACRLIPLGTDAVVYTDSELCVKTFTLWAEGWAEKDWKRKKGEVKNLDLVKYLYELLQQRPEIELKWIRSHSGNRWNEYADALATAYRRKEVVEKIGEKFI